MGNARLHVPAGHRPIAYGNLCDASEHVQRAHDGRTYGERPCLVRCTWTRRSLPPGSVTGGSTCTSVDPLKCTIAHPRKAAERRTTRWLWRSTFPRAVCQSVVSVPPPAACHLLP